MAINPQLEWHDPIDLPTGPKDPAVTGIPATPGIYVFFREHGAKVQIFYVGKAKKLHGRIKGQLNNHLLMTAISNSKNGKRRLVWASLKLKPGQKLDGALHAAEKLMIRYFFEQGQPVHNIQGIRIPTQQLTNVIKKSVKHFVPKSVTIDA